MLWKSPKSKLHNNNNHMTVNYCFKLSNALSDSSFHLVLRNPHEDGGNRCFMDSQMGKVTGPIS